MLRMRAVVAAAAVVLLVAGGCTKDEPEPNFSSVSTSATPTASPTPTESASPTGLPTTGPNVGAGEVAPTEPAAARTSDGALAFSAYYYRLSDWAFATAQTEFLQPLYASGCTTCAEGQSNLARLFTDGKYVTGGRITIRAVDLVTNDGRMGAEYAVTGTFSVAAADLHTSDGAVSQSFPANPDLQITDWLQWTATGWVIVDEGRV